MVIGIWMLDGWEVSPRRFPRSRRGRRSARPVTAVCAGRAGRRASARRLHARVPRTVGTCRVDDHPSDADGVRRRISSASARGWHAIVMAARSPARPATLNDPARTWSRSFYAMGRDGVLPPALGAARPATNIPRLTTLVTGVLVSVLAGVLADRALPRARRRRHARLDGSDRLPRRLFVLQLRKPGGAALLARSQFGRRRRRRARRAPLVPGRHAVPRRDDVAVRFDRVVRRRARGLAASASATRAFWRPVRQGERARGL